MWRDNWFLKGLKLERELKSKCITLNIFELEHLGRTKNLALELFEDKDEDVIRHRNQRWYEKIGLKWAHYAMFVLGLFWLVILIYEICRIAK